MSGHFAEAPHRATQFDTQILEPPVRVTAGRSWGGGGEALSDGYQPHAPPPAAPPELASSNGTAGAERSSGHTPVNSALNIRRDSAIKGRLPTNLVITSLVLRAAAVVSLVVAVAILASYSYTYIAGVINFTDVLVAKTYSFSSFSSTRYALAAAILGALYSIYEVISVAVRLKTGHLLLPGNISLFISYIGDQIAIVLLLTGASAAAATLKDLRDLTVTGGVSFCDVAGHFCNQGAGAVAMILLGFCFLAASLVISSYCFYRRKL